jgi:hypothetical protein
MNKCFPLLLVLLLVVRCSSIHTTTNQSNELKGRDLQPVGRYLLSKDNQLELIGTAVHFGFRFTGNNCTLFTSIPAYGSGYLQYELDGAYQKRIRLNVGLDSLTISTSSAGTHTVWIYKTTEATTGPIYIHKVVGNGLTSIEEKKQPLIEFIGNSITCGAASDASEMPCNQGQYFDHHNSYFAYSPRVARILGVSYVISSVSGIGIYRNWNSDGPTMPQVYERADFNIDHNVFWNFNHYHPEIVSIALGTNDFSNGDGVHKRNPFDSSAFISTYIKFIQLVKSKYPDAKIALLNSPMISGERGIIFDQCLNSIKRNIDLLYPNSYPVSVFHFKPMIPHGCAGHPSIEDHAVMAQEIYPFFKNLLKKP